VRRTAAVERHGGDMTGGMPEQRLSQVKAARAASRKRVTCSVSLAAHPVATVELFGAEVLPVLR
jgi:hypothetical protein